MKKSIIVILALVVLGLSAATAYANTLSGYADWSSAAPNNAPATPHDGYALKTNKCAVCHAVHKATSTGEVLLRSSVADACTYCHIDTNIGSIVIYDGDGTKYTSEAPTVAQSFGGGFAHNSGSGGVMCSECHAVHAANTLDGGNDGKILKDWGSWGSTQVGGFLDYSTLALAKFGTASVIDTIAVKYDQQTAWCTGCHKYFIESYDESQTMVQQTDFAGNITAGNSWKNYGSHVMTDAGDTYGNDAASYEATVAFAGSNQCRSCHNAGTVNSVPGTVTNSFPHYTPSWYRFMGIGANSGTTMSVNTSGTVDGLCLKCHVNSTGTQGVNISF